MNWCSSANWVASLELLCTHLVKIIDMVDTKRKLHVESEVDHTHLRLSLIRVLLVILHKMACDVAADVCQARMRIVELARDDETSDFSYEMCMHVACISNFVYYVFQNICIDINVMRTSFSLLFQ